MFKRHAWVYPGAPACDAMSWLEKNRMDCIKVEFFRVNSLGTLQRINQTSDLGNTCNGFSVANVAKYKQLAPEVLVTVAAADIAAIRRFFDASQKMANQLYNFVVNQGLHGIDLDFEGIGAWQQRDFDRYVAFIKILGTKLQSMGKKLSICCPLWTGDVTRAPFPWQFKTLATLPIDYFSIMSYDLQYDDGGGSPVASFSWLSKWMEYLVKILPLSKIVMGLPAYGYSATLHQWNDIRIRTKQQAIDARRLGTLRDPESGELKSVVGSSVWMMNDATSLKMKAAIGQKYGINQFTIWHAGGGNDCV